MPEIENEITVKLKWELDEAKVHFVNLGIPLVESFILKDIYLIKENVDINKTTNLNILDRSIIIREVLGNNHTKNLIYKDKNHDEKCNVINIKKYSCPIVDIDKTYELLTAIGFKECFRYEQECLAYSSNGKNILLEYVPDLGLFAELQNNKSVEELIEDLNDLHMPYYEDDYFVKKASLMIDEIKKKRR